MSANRRASGRGTSRRGRRPSPWTGRASSKTEAWPGADRGRPVGSASGDHDRPRRLNNFRAIKSPNWARAVQDRPVTATPRHPANLNPGMVPLPLRPRPRRTTARPLHPPARQPVRASRRPRILIRTRQRRASSNRPTGRTDSNRHRTTIPTSRPGRSTEAPGRAPLRRIPRRTSPTRGRTEGRRTRSRSHGRPDPAGRQTTPRTATPALQPAAQTRVANSSRRRARHPRPLRRTLRAASVSQESPAFPPA